MHVIYISGLTDHRINRFERYLLVWGGKYKTVAEVPNLVRYSISCIDCCLYC